MDICIVCNKITDNSKPSSTEQVNEGLEPLNFKEVITLSLQEELKETELLSMISKESSIVACSGCGNIIKELGKTLVKLKELKSILLNIIRRQENTDTRNNSDDSFFQDITEEKKSIEHEIVPEISCNECKKTFKSTKCFVIHMKKHEESKIIQEKQVDGDKYCKMCNRIFKTTRQHAKHQLTVHSIVVPVQCFLCVPNITLESEKVFVDHNKEIHSQRAECKDCKKQFFNLSILKRHERKMHTEQLDSMSICEICTKMFKSTNHLQQHLKTHSDEKHYSCNLCSKSFKWDSSLNTHIQAAHNPSGPAFKCDQCDKCFSDKNNLKKHLYVHSDIKPYVCSFQNPIFSSSYFSHWQKSYKATQQLSC